VDSLSVARRFRDALVARETQVIEDLLAEDVVVRSPIRFAPYGGREMAWRLLSAMDEALEGLALGAPLAGESGAAIPFEARALERELQGVHLLELNAEGRVSTLTLFLRPASGLEAARRAMLDVLGAPSDQ